MDLKLVRKSNQAEGIFGLLYDDQGSQIAETLEHAFRQYGGSYSPVLPRGVYKCIRGSHVLTDKETGKPKPPFSTFEVTGVTGHTGILFHIGNYNDDSHGCILVGDTRVGNMIKNSENAFLELMSLQENCNEFTLTVD